MYAEHGRGRAGRRGLTRLDLQGLQGSVLDATAMPVPRSQTVALDVAAAFTGLA
jgi:hypothetical protein